MQVVTRPKSGKKFVRVEVWFGKRLQIASMNSLLSHVRNMITGVTEGVRMKMRFAYAHFPINVTIPDASATSVEIRNFLGEKVVRKIDLQPGVTATRTDPQKTKDEIVLDGNDIDLVSRSCARIHQSCLVKRKDIRKFLDGIYVQWKGSTKEE